MNFISTQKDNDYSKCKYVSLEDKVKIRCKIHNIWYEQTPRHHMEHTGCIACLKDKLRKGKNYTKRQFIIHANKIHKYKYSYKEVEYLNWYSKIKIYCKTCKKFFIQRAGHHLSGSGCPFCNRVRGYSNTSQECIKEIEKKSRLTFQYFIKGSEYKVRSNNKFGVYKLDGYNKRYNIAIEFNGDIWHGNPKLYKPKQKCNPLYNKTSNYLYKKTKEKETVLSKLGYNVISIWEYDWLNNKDSTLKKVLNKINLIKKKGK